MVLRHHQNFSLHYLWLISHWQVTTLNKKLYKYTEETLTWVRVSEKEGLEHQHENGLVTQKRQISHNYRQAVLQTCAHTQEPEGDRHLLAISVENSVFLCILNTYWFLCSISGGHIYATAEFLQLILKMELCLGFDSPFLSKQKALSVLKIINWLVSRDHYLTEAILYRMSCDNKRFPSEYRWLI